MPAFGESCRRRGHVLVPLTDPDRPPMAERLFAPPKFFPNFDLLSELLYDPVVGHAFRPLSMWMRQHFGGWPGDLAARRMTPAHRTAAPQWGRGAAVRMTLRTLGAGSGQLSSASGQKDIHPKADGSKRRATGSRVCSGGHLRGGSASRTGSDRGAASTMRWTLSTPGFIGGK
jgi:hypothetical protein